MPAQETIGDPRAGTRAGRGRSNEFGALWRVGVPVALWIAFVNVASHYQPKGLTTDAILHEAVEAELASRRCPDLRLDPAGFQALARDHGVNHADLYQKRSPRLQKAADRLDRLLRADPDGECQRLFDLYGGADGEPHLLARRGTKDT